VDTKELEKTTEQKKPGKKADAKKSENTTGQTEKMTDAREPGKAPEVKKLEGATERKKCEKAVESKESHKPINLKRPPKPIETAKSGEQSNLKPPAERQRSLKESEPSAESKKSTEPTDLPKLVKSSGTEATGEQASPYSVMRETEVAQRGRPVYEEYGSSRGRPDERPDTRCRRERASDATRSVDGGPASPLRRHRSQYVRRGSAPGPEHTVSNSSPQRARPETSARTSATRAPEDVGRPPA
jgi:hypothetical protein